MVIGPDVVIEDGEWYNAHITTEHMELDCDLLMSSGSCWAEPLATTSFKVQVVYRFRLLVD